jgi:hypothetical protein
MSRKTWFSFWEFYTLFVKPYADYGGIITMNATHAYAKQMHSEGVIKAIGNDQKISAIEVRNRNRVHAWMKAMVAGAALAKPEPV